MYKDTCSRAFLRSVVMSLLLIISSSPILNISAQKNTAKGKLIGIVRNERNELLAAATIHTVDKIIQTNINGEFEIELSEGLYTVTVSYVGYETKIITDLAIKNNAVTRQTVFLDPSGNYGGKEVVVTTTSSRKESIAGAYRIQKNNIAVSDVISIEQIKRTPDNNVAQSLSRMNGITILENKFVIIRGMGDRYNNVLINGSQLPSTEPNKRNFSFDILPTSLIDNIVVNKTATPDLPADFAGGLVQVNTKDVPEKNMFYFSAGTGMNTNSTGKPFYSAELTGREYFAKLDDRRKWYLNKWDPVEYFRLRSSTGAEAVQKQFSLNAAIPNLWGLYAYTAKPSQDYQAGLGLRKRFKNNSSLGTLLALTYRNEQLKEDYSRKTYFQDSVTGNRYNFTTSINGLFSIAFTTGKNKFAFKNIYTRRLNYDTYVFAGVNSDILPLRNYAIFTNFTDLLQNRLEGEHVVFKNDTRIKWYADRSEISRDQPDTRTVSYRKLNSSGDYFEIDYTDVTRPAAGGVFSSALTEKRFGAGADIQVPFKISRTRQTFKLGYFGTQRETGYAFSFLRPLFYPSADKDKVYGLPIYKALTTENFSDGTFYYRSLATRGNSDDDRYSGKMNLHAAYGMLDAKLSEKLRFIGGVRMEKFKMTVTTVIERDTATGKVGNILKDSTAVIDKTDFFPSASLIFGLNAKSNIRLAYAKTVARPDFREISPVYFYDFSLPGSITGNSFLVNTYIHNIDLRYELFPTANEILTVSAFYKKFTDPIETLVGEANGSEFTYINVNQQSSSNIGAEIDFRKSLSFIHPSAFLSRLYVNANASLMSSTVTVDRNRVGEILKLINPTYPFDPAQKDERKRPLQGLSPYAVNAGIMYQGERFGLNITYNRIGKRLVFLGPESYLDFYENSRNVIDGQLYVRLLKQKLEAKLNVSDILGQSFIQYNNSTAGRGLVTANDDPKGNSFNRDYDFIIYEGKRGTGISFSVSYTF